MEVESHSYDPAMECLYCWAARTVSTGNYFLSSLDEFVEKALDRDRGRGIHSFDYYVRVCANHEPDLAASILRVERPG